ncbi:MAG: MerR family transcriptional regulator [Anaerolineales bacterium]|nr:MerR family transcriptional regulator [Anaerolineales bacterium]
MPSTAYLPTYNLKAVVHETGLKPDTLRAWERRYGLPQPNRSGGGHRLYSQRDVETLKWLVARQQEGMSISRAADLWQRHISNGEDPLSLPLYRASDPARQPAVSGAALSELRQAWVAACMAYDEPRAEASLSQAFALYPAESVLVDILQRGLSEIGDAWYAGGSTTQQEHFASELAERRLEALLLSNPPPTRKGRILVICPAGEQHTFAPLLLTLFLRRRGWHVAYLGANVPLEDLDRALTGSGADLVITPVQTLPAAARLPAIDNLLQTRGIPLAYGGRIVSLVPDLRQALPGHFLGDTLSEAPAMVEALLSGSAPSPRPKKPSSQYRRAQEEFDSHLAGILAEVVSGGGGRIPPEIQAEVNANFSAEIHAALVLGDMNLLGSDIAWVEGLINNRGFEPDLLRPYLQIYSRAVARKMGESGRPILEWFSRTVRG